MGGWAARKALNVVKNVEVVLGIELMIACQAIDFLRPLTTTKPLEALHDLVRQEIAHWEEDRYIKPDMEKAIEMVKAGRVSSCVEHILEEVPELQLEEPERPQRKMEVIVSRKKEETGFTVLQGLLVGAGLGILFSCLVILPQFRKQV